MGTVRKQRRLYRVGQTRVHLDRVEDLGDFVELEVVLDPGQTETEGTAIAEDLMRRFAIRASSLCRKPISICWSISGANLLPRPETGSAAPWNDPARVMRLHANMRIISSGQGRGQQDHHGIRPGRLVGSLQQFLADSLTLIGLIDGQIGQVDAEAEIGNRAEMPTSRP